MPLNDLIIATPEEAQEVSEADSLDRWTTIDVSGAGLEAFHCLAAHRLGKSFQEVNDSAEFLTEMAADAEPWDESAWVTPVVHLPRDYVAALASIPDDEIPPLAGWWWSTDAFDPYRQPGCGINEEVLRELLTDTRAFLRAAGERSVLMRIAM